MARIESPYTIAGTYGNLVVYQVGSNLYARKRSSLTRKRFQKDPAFAKAREKAVQFGEAARLTKIFYSTLPKTVKKHGLFGKLTGLAHSALQAGMRQEQVIHELHNYVGVELTVPSETLSAISYRSKITVDQQEPSRSSTKSLSAWSISTTGSLEMGIRMRTYKVNLIQKAITSSGPYVSGSIITLDSRSFEKKRGLIQFFDHLEHLQIQVDSS